MGHTTGGGNTVKGRGWGGPGFQTTQNERDRRLLNILTPTKKQAIEIIVAVTVAIFLKRVPCFHHPVDYTAYALWDHMAASSV